MKVLASLLLFASSPIPSYRGASLGNLALSFLPLLCMVSTAEVDTEYPGTAVARREAICERAKSVDLNGDWEDVRRRVLWAGGLRDLSSSRPGEGYTGHSFADFNHVDLTAMKIDHSDDENEGRVSGIHRKNPLGKGIRIASIGAPELPPGGSWSTCMIGCNSDPPHDVAHVQFKSRIAFKLVWTPPLYDQFVLVDDAGALLNQGKPSGVLPHITERMRNYAVVKGSKYAKAADEVGGGKGSAGKKELL